MHRAQDRVTNSDWLAELRTAAATLGMSPETTAVAEELFLSDVPTTPSSKQVAVAASLYAAGRIEDEACSQQTVADAVGVARLSVQHHWRDRLTAAGVVPPDW